MKILNLYAGLGGNRKLWNGDIEVTAVELCEKTAAFYQSQFSNDTVIVSDAHEYLRQHYSEFDFIWSSPPCQTHSSIRHNLAVRFRGTQAEYPDMKLYQEILFLRHNVKGKYLVENVKPYYKPLITPDFELHRHFFWSNIQIKPFVASAPKLRTAQIPDLQRAYGFDLTGWSIPDKRQCLRNCVLPELGKHIFDCITDQRSITPELTIEDFLQVER